MKIIGYEIVLDSNLKKLEFQLKNEQFICHPDLDITSEVVNKLIEAMFKNFHKTMKIMEVK